MVIWLKRFYISFIVYFFLQGCSSSTTEARRSIYSLEEMEVKKFEYIDEWYLRPLLHLDNGVSIKIHPTSWYSYTHEFENCNKEQSVFYLMLWAQNETKINVESSYFLNTSKEKVKVALVENDGKFRLQPINNEYFLSPSQYSQDYLQDQFQNGNYLRLRDNTNMHAVKLLSDSFVGCSEDKYSLVLDFDSQEYKIYFYPAIYKSFSH